MWSEDRLSRLPTVGGFRQRGLAMTRIETFTDAAFAFALTLLVISFDDIPDSIADLELALKNIPAFAVSFAMIAMFWFAHHRWSRFFGLDDGATVILSLMLVFVTLVFAFPLRLMSSALMSWLTGGWVPFEMTQYSGNVVAYIFVVYGSGLMLMSGLICLLYAHALRVPELNLSRQERWIAKTDLQAWLILLAVAAISTAFASLAPQEWRPWAGFAYAPLGIVMPLFAWTKARSGPAADAGGT